MQTHDPVGWFGKLPTLGDFATRRLSPDFIEAWDGWLSAALAEWRNAAPDTWLDAYLAGPTWRFVLMPGALPAPCSATGWAGVLMPSVDRVGRYFPFTFAVPLPQLPADAAQTGALLACLHRLDDMAVDALHEDWTVDQLEAALRREHEAGPTAAMAGGPLADLDEICRDPDQRGHTFWLSADTLGQPLLRTEQGLPQAERFIGLLSGQPANSLTQANTNFHDY